MKKFITFFSMIITVLTIMCMSSEAYVYISVTGTNVNIRPEAKTGGEVITQASLGEIFVAEDKPETNSADGSEWYKLIMTAGNGYMPLAANKRFGVAAAYIHSNYANVMNMTPNEEKLIADILAGKDYEIVERVLSPIGDVIEEETGIKTIKVANSREFLEALGSDRIIEMSPGIYNLSVWDPFLNNQPEQAPRYPNLGNQGGLKLSQGVSWEDLSGEGELTLNGIKNLTIRGWTVPGSDQGDDVLRRDGIVIDPRYAFVLKFVDCSDIVIEGLKAGHSEGGYCEGGVFGYKDSSRITIERTEMYGCGTVGLELRNVSDMKVTNSWIYECTYSIMNVTGGANIAFDNCAFRRNMQYTLVEVSKTGNLSFANCEFSGNSGEMFGVRDTTISVSDSTFNQNESSLPIQYSNNVEFTNCVFD